MKILKRIKYYIRISLYTAKLEMLCQMEYPSFLFGWLIANPLQYILGLLSINVTISNFHDLGGWGFNEIVFLYGISTISHGLTVIFFIQTRYLQWMVTEGGFDRMLLRPMNVFGQFATMEANLIGITDLIPGFAILIYGCKLVGFQPTFFNILRLVVVILGATVLREGILLGTASIAFFTKRSWPLVELELRMFDYACMYPITIYPRIIQIILTYILPMAFISFYPAGEFLGKARGLVLPNNIWVFTVLIGVLFFAGGYAIFKKGLDCYESSGS